MAFVGAVAKRAYFESGHQRQMLTIFAAGKTIGCPVAVYEFRNLLLS